jgi:hypothetical protein
LNRDGSFALFGGQAICTESSAANRHDLNFHRPLARHLGALSAFEGSQHLTGLPQSVPSKAAPAAFGHIRRIRHSGMGWGRLSLPGMPCRNELLKQVLPTELANAQQLLANLPRTLLAKAANKAIWRGSRDSFGLVLFVPPTPPSYGGRPGG